MGFFDLFRHKPAAQAIRCHQCRRPIRGKPQSLEGYQLCQECHVRRYSLLRQTGDNPTAGPAPAASGTTQAAAPQTFVCRECGQERPLKYLHRNQTCTDCLARQLLQPAAPAAEPAPAAKPAAPAPEIPEDKPDLQTLFDEDARRKDAAPPVSMAQLEEVFTRWIEPHLSFFPPLNQEGILLDAAGELFEHIDLFTAATKWPEAVLDNVVDTSSREDFPVRMSALCYLLGQYAVFRHDIWFVDFSEQIPNCIAMYLLFTAQSLPRSQRVQQIDIGVGTDPKPLQSVLDRMRFTDPLWDPIILKA